MAFRIVLDYLINEEIGEIDDIHQLILERRMIRDTSNPFELPEENFKSFFRFTKEMSREVIQILSPHLRDGIRSTAIPKELKVLAALNFFAHGSYQKNIGNDFNLGLSQPAVSNCITEVTSSLLHIMGDYVQFPTTEHESRIVKQQFLDKFNIGGTIGIVDGTHVAIIAPPMGDEENPPIVYYNRKGFYSINVQIICDANLKILSANARFPGSRHDSVIWASSAIRRLLNTRYNNGERNTWLLGDSGYPLEPWLLTPIVDALPETQEARYTDLHCRVRNTIERCIGVLKMRFRCLTKTRTLMFQPLKASRVIYACIVLHNIATRFRLEDDGIFDDGMEDFVDNENQLMIQDGQERLQNILREGRRTRDNFIRMYVN